MSRLSYLLASTVLLLVNSTLPAQPLSGTQPLETKQDLAKVMVEGIGKYLDRETAAARQKRTALWKVDRSSYEKYENWLAPHRERLRKMLGIIDTRVAAKVEHVSSVEQPALVAETKQYKIYQVRWPVLPGVYGEGLLLEPFGPNVSETPKTVIALPDADWTPEMICGLAPGLASEAQFGRRWAEDGYRVLIPTLIDRKDAWSGNTNLGRMTNQPHREFVYRMSYQMGRHVIGYELQRILGVVDWLRGQGVSNITIAGYGEGGLLALYAAAVDPRLPSPYVSGYFGPRHQLWREPIYRNIWGFARTFGDAELGVLARRDVFVEHSNWPTITGPPSERPGRRGAAPGVLSTPFFNQVEQELARILELDPEQRAAHTGPIAFTPEKGILSLFHEKKNEQPAAPTDLRKNFDPTPRQKRQFDQLVDYTQKLLPEAAAKRQAFVWNKLDTSSLEKLQKSQEPLRDHFHEEIIGKLPKPELPMNPRTRLIYDTPKFKGYEVTLDLYEDVNCYGILLVPNDIKPGEKRPVVVCQHGLEGRPTDVCDPTKKTKYYNSFGAQLAERGYVVFAPQNPYIFGNEFRQLVRKANPLKLTLYSFIVRQHERILDWLCTLPFVDGARIAYYGLSYGGKVAMRIPVLVGRYALVICSGDFNEWIWKNITLDWTGSYMFSGEYEMYEFDLGNTFNYAEMAALIAPRPFMVERGHNDGVGLDEYVAFEYAKVRRFYAKLGIPERTEIEFFQGGHEIHGQGTFTFLDRHLNWTPTK